MLYIFEALLGEKLRMCKAQIASLQDGVLCYVSGDWSSANRL